MGLKTHLTLEDQMFVKNFVSVRYRAPVKIHNIFLDVGKDEDSTFVPPETKMITVKRVPSWTSSSPRYREPRRSNFNKVPNTK